MIALLVADLWLDWCTARRVKSIEINGIVSFPLGIIEIIEIIEIMDSWISAAFLS